MEIIISQKLKEHLTKKKIKDITIDNVRVKIC